VVVVVAVKARRSRPRSGAAAVLTAMAATFTTIEAEEGHTCTGEVRAAA
jgi:hypothetical protein